MPYRHTTPIQIRFADLDALNHVNNANYLTYIELARIHYLHDVVKAKLLEPEFHAVYLCHPSEERMITMSPFML